MLKIQIVAIGKDKDNWVTQGYQHYSKLLKKYCQLSYRPLPSIKHSQSLATGELKRKEAELLLSKIKFPYTISLSDSGKKMDSYQFASWLEKTIPVSQGAMTFIIGGPYGLDKRILDASSHTLSLSPLTMSHQIVRLVLLEQLYRAFSINHNTDYHK